ncbi:MAG: LuxR C-terminal-related transcriptional regulator [Candidatus Dormibacteria bacterium]
MLGSDEQAVLRRLSVFPGTFSLEAAEYVCKGGTVGPGGVFDALSALVERSFVNCEATSGSARYRLHESMREFALLRLVEAGEEGLARHAHLSFFAEMCWPARFDHGRADGEPTIESLSALDREADNLRAALRQCLVDPEGADVGLAMVAGLGRYWANRALSEGVHWSDALLRQRGSDEAVRGRALYVRGELAVTQGDHIAGLGVVAEAGAIARRLKDDSLLVRTLAIQAALQVIAGELPGARLSSAEAKALADSLGDDMSFIAAAQSEAFLAFIDGDFVRMRDIGLDAAARCRQRNELYMLSTHLTSAGTGSLMLGEHAAAEQSLIGALRATLAVDDRPGLVLRVETLACNAASAGDNQRAARLLGAAEMLRKDGGYEVSPFTRLQLEQANELAKGKLGEGTFKAAFDAGTQLDREAAIALALGTNVEQSRRVIAKRADPLGKRQREVAELIAQGLSNKEIATRLFLSERTVETHVYNTLNRLGFSSRAQIAAWISTTA